MIVAHKIAVASTLFTFRSMNGSDGFVDAIPTLIVHFGTYDLYDVGCQYGTHHAAFLETFAFAPSG